jgi:hypothetical protein
MDDEERNYSNWQFLAIVLLCIGGCLVISALLTLMGA